MHAVFPVFLKLSDRPVLVVGGGAVAAAKIAALRAAGAAVTVVAPDIRPDILAQPVATRIGRFRSTDLDGVWFVVSASTPAVNRRVADLAGRRGIFVNAVDDPAHASAFLGGVVRRQGVVIAISTEGHAPALAALLREGLEALLPADLDRWLARGRALRPEWRRRGVPMARRRPDLLRALNRLYRQEPAQ